MFNTYREQKNVLPLSFKLNVLGGVYIEARRASPVTRARWISQADFNMWQAGSPKQVMNLKFTFSQGIVIVMTTFRIVHRDINV
jgi:hypothetical protein